MEWKGTGKWVGWKFTQYHDDSGDPVLISPTGRAYRPEDIEPEEYTQSDLARILNVTRGAIADRIRRSTLPDFDNGSTWSRDAIVDIVRRDYARIIHQRLSRYLLAVTHMDQSRIAANLERLKDTDKSVFMGLEESWISRCFTEEEQQQFNITRTFMADYLASGEFVSMGGEQSQLTDTLRICERYLQ